MLRLVFSNSKGHHVLDVKKGGLADQATAVELRRWLDSAIAAASKENAPCAMFMVAVHQEGADCDHEVPRG